MTLAQTAYQRFLAQLRDLSHDDWSRPTDCPAWDVRALASHRVPAKEAGDAVVDLGTPLGHGRHLDGSQVTPGDTDLAGYSILQADSLDDVVKLLERHPHVKVPENSVEVLPTLAMPGM